MVEESSVELMGVEPTAFWCRALPAFAGFHRRDDLHPSAIASAGFA